MQQNKKQHATHWATTKLYSSHWAIHKLHSSMLLLHRRRNLDTYHHLARHSLAPSILWPPVTQVSSNVACWLCQASQAECLMMFFLRIWTAGFSFSFMPDLYIHTVSRGEWGIYISQWPMRFVVVVLVFLFFSLVFPPSLFFTVCFHGVGRNVSAEKCIMMTIITINTDDNNNKN